MEGRQTYFWRIFATGLCFTLFGLGGLILGMLVFPVTLLLPGGPAHRRARMRGLVQRALRLFVRVMNGVRVISYEFHGSERLGRPGQLIIANHPTLVDVVFIVAFTPAPCCVVKAALFRNPFTRAVVRAAGYISNSPTDEMIHGAVAALVGYKPLFGLKPPLVYVTFAEKLPAGHFMLVAGALNFLSIGHQPVLNK